MKVELIVITPDCERVIEEAGRTCYKSQVGNPTIIKNWINVGHESVIEHASATFRISEISRALTHQLVRHRIASYSQQSQRYVNENGFGFIIPPTIENHEDDRLFKMYCDVMDTLQQTYEMFIANGVPKEDARFVLPNACHTEIVVSMNFRAMRNFFKLRLDSHAQWEIRWMANLMLKIVKDQAPNVFYDMEVSSEYR